MGTLFFHRELALHGQLSAKKELVFFFKSACYTFMIKVWIARVKGGWGKFMGGKVCVCVQVRTINIIILITTQIQMGVKAASGLAKGGNNVHKF